MVNTPDLILAKPQSTTLPEKGSQVVVPRPAETAYLPTLAHVERSVVQLAGRFSWYVFDAGPQITAFLNPDYAGYKKKQHLLVWNDKPCILGTLVSINEVEAVFEVTASAPTYLTQYFRDVLQKLSDRVSDTQTLIWASDWYHHQHVSMDISRSGSGITFVWGHRAINQGTSAQLLAQLEELYQKLPSGSGWNNHWHVAWLGDHIQAETSFSPMNDFGYYLPDIALSYDLRWIDGQWVLEDRSNLNQEIDEEAIIDFDDFYLTLKESLNAH